MSKPATCLDPRFTEPMTEVTCSCPWRPVPYTGPIEREGTYPRACHFCASVLFGGTPTESCNNGHRTSLYPYEGANELRARAANTLELHTPGCLNGAQLAGRYIRAAMAAEVYAHRCMPADRNFWRYSVCVKVVDEWCYVGLDTANR